eukprot:COSAG01_NODE_1561_length_9917_cov_5.742514_12_plen_175_part_00
MLGSRLFMRRPRLLELPHSQLLTEDLVRRGGAILGAPAAAAFPPSEVGPRLRLSWRDLHGHAPARPFPSSIFRDKNRRDIGKSQSMWTDSKTETAGSQRRALGGSCPPRGKRSCRRRRRRAIMIVRGLLQLVRAAERAARGGLRACVQAQQARPQAPASPSAAGAGGDHGIAKT